MRKLGVLAVFSVLMFSGSAQASGDLTPNCTFDCAGGSICCMDAQDSCSGYCHFCDPGANSASWGDDCDFNGVPGKVCQCATISN